MKPLLGQLQPWADSESALPARTSPNNDNLPQRQVRTPVALTSWGPTSNDVRGAIR